MPDRRPRRYLRPAFATTFLGAVTVAVLGVALVVTAPAAGAQSSGAATPDTPTAATTPPGKPGIYYAGWGLLAIGGVLALAAIAGYLRFAPDFSRGRK